MTRPFVHIHTLTRIVGIDSALAQTFDLPKVTAARVETTQLATVELEFILAGFWKCLRA